MDETRWRREVSEGSLLTMVEGNLGNDQICRGGEGRGERGARTMNVGEGPDDSLEERGGYRHVTWRETGEDVGSRGEGTVERIKTD